MLLSFMMSWSPFGWLYFEKLLGFRAKNSMSRSDMISLLSVKLGCGVINPLLYGFENPKVFKNLCLPNNKHIKVISLILHKITYIRIIILAIYICIYYPISQCQRPVKGHRSLTIETENKLGSVLRISQLKNRRYSI